ncbi:rab proteins geranylgeranyltransferase component A, putative [Phytophthora infestans T30-4]|uniref:Rab proteins geranylgeranyltransferase component A, putative n=1 Tax=Phytophthora infestans (strain T30-4) TaxID=403677 RepID=D0NLA6_PHYIT|nr:rab proteins geranylgeranyltransferase component A, putative [Phytophthora infestans T30-4]EEY60424.1 rab proteins geranylgeranyltransferase component A, putative [Phytophthora infestans T30-4]|eukprot:XP_002900220.1 rab proteins geranylgeranyltransferase component A, putative [Phytophthora infestans T30-4]
MDASLKETEYDVLLVGTGMVEGILAGALARIGKKVLHLDQNDYYGSNYASFPLTQFLRWTKNEAIAPRNFGDELENSGKEPVANATATIGTATLQMLPMQNSFECRLLEEGFSDDATKEELLQKSSHFSIDVNPRLMLSSEQLVETLITSGVGRYLEFAAIERTYVHFQPSTKPEGDTDTVWEVPCSKKDVFQSKLLGMVEKRQLMKFLQFVADYGETHILHEDVKTKNERSLALGRALKRPQNKASQADTDAELAAYLDNPFQELLEKHFNLSSKLQQVVVYCVGLASFPATKNQLSARDGLAAVYRYVASIGRFTGTAFLAPLYGISELAQSFCRLSAVYGGIYVLRAPIDAFVLDTETKELVGVRCSDGDVLRAKSKAKDAEDVHVAASVSENDATESEWSDRIAWRVIFTMDHLASGDIDARAKTEELPTNAWVCETVTGGLRGVSPLEIHLESASANARAIFEVLCPGEPFLPKSASAEQAEQEEQESEEDAVLQAAQKLAQQTQLITGLVR